MRNLSDRVSALEATISSECVACDERSRTIHVGEDSGPAACPDCGRPIEVEHFTIRIDRAEPWEGDAAGAAWVGTWNG